MPLGTRLRAGPQQGFEVASLILAPHFDDAVYSCGAMVARSVAAGEVVTLLTVCGGEIPPDPPATNIVRELHTRWRAVNGGVLPSRLAEECTATSALAAGVMARVMAMPLLDCIYRRDREGRALYTRGAQLGGAPHPADPLPAQLRATAWLAEMVASEVYLPLAVGGHVDHRIVRDWALEWFAARPDVAAYAYADFPYTRNEGAIAAALASLPAPWVASPTAAVDPTAAEMDAKIVAIRAYRSQNSSFWMDDDAMAAEVRATPERVWRLSH